MEVSLANDIGVVDGFVPNGYTAAVVRFDVSEDGRTDAFQEAADEMHCYSCSREARDRLKAGSYQLVLVKLET